MSVIRELKLRGALSFLGRAQMHIGKNQPIDEWGSGGYRDKALEVADNILRLAGWKVEKELRDLKQG